MNNPLMLIAKISADPIPKVSASKVLTSTLNTVYFVVGMISIIVLLMSAFQFLTANGDTSKTKKAIQTIIYAIVGLIVVISAFAITNVVFGS